MRGISVSSSEEKQPRSECWVCRFPLFCVHQIAAMAGSNNEPVSVCARKSGWRWHTNPRSLLLGLPSRVLTQPSCSHNRQSFISEPERDLVPQRQQQFHVVAAKVSAGGPEKLRGRKHQAHPRPSPGERKSHKFPCECSANPRTLKSGSTTRGNVWVSLSLCDLPAVPHQASRGAVCDDCDCVDPTHTHTQETLGARHATCIPVNFPEWLHS